MVVQLIFMAFWRRSLPQLQRSPESIAAVMTYVAGTSMSRDFEEFSQMTTKERDAAVKELGKEYAYGWRREEGGRVRWVVDEMQTKENRALMDHY